MLFWKPLCILLAPLNSVIKSLWLRDIWFCVLVMPALFQFMKRRRHIENLLTVLDRDHTPGRETATIAGPIHLIDDRNRGIPRTHEIGVQRMTGPAFSVDRAISSDQCLGDHLSAKNTLVGLVLRTLPAEEVYLQALKVHKVQ